MDYNQGSRAVASGGARGALAVFGQIVNPISTKGADYTHHSTTSPPGISDLATGLYSGASVAFTIIDEKTSKKSFDYD